MGHRLEPGAAAPSSHRRVPHQVRQARAGGSVARESRRPGERGESLIRRWIAKATITAAAGILLAGCGVQPCPVAESMVETARGQASQAKQAADEAQSRKSDLESQIQSKQARVRELENQKTKIEAELSELLGT